MKNLFIILLLVVSVSSCDFAKKDTKKANTTESTVSSETEKFEFNVAGMDSQYSEKIIEIGLKKLEGVSGVDACFKDKKVILEVEKGKINRKTISDAISKLGFKVK